MKNKFNIHFCGNESEQSKTLEAFLQGQTWFSCIRHYSPDENTLPWVENKSNKSAEVVVLCLDDNWLNTLSLLHKEKNNKKAPYIVIGPGDNVQAMRSAMQAGAKDYIPFPVESEEVTRILLELCNQQVSSLQKKEQKITTIINAKGGCGSSFITTHLAHVMSAYNKLHTLILDFDLQFGVQNLNLDMQIDNKLTDVLGMVNGLDAVALHGYTHKHSNGLYLLSENIEDIVLPEEISLPQVERLLSLSANAFDQVIIDLPRQIDSLFSTIVSKSDHIVLVLQQSISAVRDTKRLLSILKQEFDIPEERITVLINRYDDQNALTLNALKSTIDHSNFSTLPNDYRRAATAIDTATPLYSQAPSAPLTKALINFSSQLRGDEEKKVAFLQRAFGSFMKKKKIA